MSNIKFSAGIINGLVTFLYFYYAYTTNPNSIKWAILGTFLSMFVFQGELIENFGIESGSYAYYKFLIFPRIVYGALSVYVLFKWQWLRRNMAWVFILIGGIGIFTGARSSGMMPLFAGIITLFVQRSSTTMRHLRRNALACAVLLYGAYATLYVPNVLNGTIQSGNSKQLLQAENPYNPFNLLLIGRADAIVPFMAFLDRPIFGWGTEAMDTPNYKYNRMAFEFSNKDDDNADPLGLLNITRGRIPGHSTWGVYACYYGIFGFTAFLLMMIRLWKLAVGAIRLKSKDTFLIIYFTLSYTWVILFSANGIKINSTTLAMILALIVITYNTSIQKSQT